MVFCNEEVAGDDEVGVRSCSDWDTCRKWSGSWCVGSPCWFPESIHWCHSPPVSSLVLASLSSWSALCPVRLHPVPACSRWNSCTWSDCQHILYSALLSGSFGWTAPLFHCWNSSTIWEDVVLSDLQCTSPQICRYSHRSLVSEHLPRCTRFYLSASKSASHSLFRATFCLPLCRIICHQNNGEEAIKPVLSNYYSRIRLSPLFPLIVFLLFLIPRHLSLFLIIRYSISLLLRFLCNTSFCIYLLKTFLLPITDVVITNVILIKLTIAE